MPRAPIGSISTSTSREQIKLPTGLLQYSPVSPVPELSIHNAGGGRLLSVTNQPFGVVAHLESSGVNTPRIETEVILFNGQKKIEFINHVHKTEVYTKEGVYFAFPFAMEHPQFRYEIQNGFVDPSRDQLPGAGKEWFSVQHWVAAEQGGVTAALVPVDAPLVALGDIVRGTWPVEFGQRPGTIFSYVMNNYWDTNYAAGQGGDFTFRYVLTSGNNLPPAYLSRLGREEMSPLEVDQITSQDKAINSPRPLDSAQGSFLQCGSTRCCTGDLEDGRRRRGHDFAFCGSGRKGKHRGRANSAPRREIGMDERCSGEEAGASYGFFPWLQILRQAVSDRHGAFGGGSGSEVTRKELTVIQ